MFLKYLDGQEIYTKPLKCPASYVFPVFWDTSAGSPLSRHIDRNKNTCVPTTKENFAKIPLVLPDVILKQGKLNPRLLSQS